MRLVACLLVLAAAAAPAGVSLASPAPDPKALVLRLQDLPTGYKVGSAHSVPLEMAAREAWGKATLERWGYLGGYDARYTLDTSNTGDLLAQPALVESTVSVYRSAAGAHASVAASAALCNKPPNSELALGTRIGDEAHLCYRKRTVGAVASVVYAVIWRDGRLKAGVQIAGFEGAASAALAVRLAKEQDSRFP